MRRLWRPLIQEKAVCVWAAQKRLEHEMMGGKGRGYLSEEDLRERSRY